MCEPIDFAMTQRDLQFTTALGAIPDDNSISYFGQSDYLSSNSKGKGLKYYIEGYIHDVRVCDGTDSTKCWQSMCKSKPAHNLSVDINSSTKKIIEAHCSCQAGMSGKCSHVVGLTKTLQAFKLHNLTIAPDQQSCTSIPQQWNIPRGLKVSPVPVNHLVIAKPLDSRKRKPITCQMDPNTKLPKINEIDIARLRDVSGTPLPSRLVRTQPSVDTPFGPVPLGSTLSHQTRNLKEVTRSQGQGCGPTWLTNSPAICLPQEFQHINQIYPDVDTKIIEQQTTAQTNCVLWRELRINRLISSNFANVLQRKTMSDKFLDTLFKYRELSAPSLDYGRRHECVAKQSYLQLNPNAHIHECGLVVRNEFKFLGASPDGKVCEGGAMGGS